MSRAHPITGKPAPMFFEFSWVDREKQRGPYDLMSDVHDIAAGVSIALEMVAHAHTAMETGEAPMVGRDETAKLLRMSIASMNCIEHRLFAYFQHLDDPEECPPTEIVRDGVK